MKETQETAFKDLFYNIDDLRNLFSAIEKEKYYKNYRIKASFPVWTGEDAFRLSYFKRFKIESD